MQQMSMCPTLTIKRSLCVNPHYVSLPSTLTLVFITHAFHLKKNVFSDLRERGREERASERASERETSMGESNIYLLPLVCTP